MHVLVAGYNAADAAQHAAQIQGVAKVLLTDAPQLEEQLAENVAEQVLAIAKDYSHIVFPATAARRVKGGRAAQRQRIFDAGSTSFMIRSIVCAPDELRDALRRLTRMQLIRTLAAWRSDSSDYRNVASAYRISLKSLGRRYPELHDEIDSMTLNASRRALVSGMREPALRHWSTTSGSASLPSRTTPRSFSNGNRPPVAI